MDDVDGLFMDEEMVWMIYLWMRKTVWKVYPWMMRRCGWSIHG
jgi:hypothetical protein